ncbi:hypothetical protein DPMN_149068 [Dreissena polymorpha]|uniref:Uncharacterized protein n=1 Tax=Dreissena polymorpha TaxID=45954 RepID=A0A9D4J4L4_DREPO|nr:hypothetical protein DPMN_149068 [Dreissena polymorpha]
MNLLTTFHEGRKINVASREYCSAHWWPCFQANVSIFKLFQDIIETNFLTKFHEDWTINVASRVLTRKNAPPPGDHVFKATKTILELIQDIIGTNLLTKFHEYHKINVTSRVLTRRNAPPPGGHINEDWTINVVPIALKRFYYSHIKPYKEKSPPLGSHVFQANATIFELIQDIIETNVLTKLHDDWTINVASRVLTSHIWKNAPPSVGHVFKATETIFELTRDIIGTHLLTKFHEDRKINEKCNAPGGHVFQATGIILKIVQDITGMNLLTMFHEDRKINVTSRVLTRFYYNHI